MGQFVDDIINSSKVINAATILSVILAIVFFVYQEYKKQKEQQKEIIRLEDEVISLIIRNHINSGVPISRIDLFSLIEGFQKNKNCILRLDIGDILKMVYAKVYENEHITNNIRLDFLKELDEMIESNKYELTEPKKESNSYPFFSTKMFLPVLFVSLVMIFQVVIVSNKTLKLDWIYLFVALILLVFVVMLLVFLKPLINRAIYGPSDFSVENDFIKVSRPRDTTEFDFNANISKPPTFLSEVKDDVIHFEDIENHKEINTIFQQRLIIEKALRDIYFFKFKESTKLPVSRLASLLADEEIIPKSLLIHIRRFYSSSSYVIHEGVLPTDIHDFNEIIIPMKEIASSLYTKFKEITIEAKKTHDNI